MIVPRAPYEGRRPLVSYQVAIDSRAPHCNPSYTFRTGENKEIPSAVAVLSLGWAVVVPDFEGPRDAYGAGPMAGHATLDGIRAASAYHSVLDELIPIRGPDAMVATGCAGGVTVQYERSLLGEHVAYAVPGGAQAVLYLRDRFAGKPAPSNC